MIPSAKLNIWLIQIGEPLPIEESEREMRTNILAQKLIERDHSIVWWGSAFDHFTKKWRFKADTQVELGKDFHLYLLKGVGYKRNISLRRFIDHRVVAAKFRKLSSTLPKPDIIVNSMPPHDLAYEVVRFGKTSNIPVIIDIRDPWPDLFLNHVPKLFQGISKVLLRKDFAMARNTMTKSDALIAVNDTFLEWGLGDAKRPKTDRDKVFYLGYRKKIVNCGEIPRIRRVTEELKTKFVVAFVGTFGHYHNPSILIDCAGKSNRIRSDIHFVLAGDGEYLDEIRKRSRDLPNVTFTGWLNQGEMDFLLAKSDVGICPTSRNTDLFPNKAFIYLSWSLPIVSAFGGDLKESSKNMVSDSIIHRMMLQHF